MLRQPAHRASPARLAFGTSVNVPLKNPTTLADRPEAAVVAILVAASVCHCLNDTIQSLQPAIYPILKDGFRLDFGQIGLITFVFQVTASLLQPFVGLFTDRRPQPYSLPVGMGFSLIGLLLLSVAPSYWILLLAAGLIGIGSSIFHPESSRVARLASGGRHGLAQSVFQLGGNVGHAVGPLLAAFIVVQHGRGSIAWFSVIALVGMAILWRVGIWYRDHRRMMAARPARPELRIDLPRRTVLTALVVLVLLTFSKHFYVVSLSSYYTFFLIEKFGVSVQASQLYLFVFLLASAAGVVIGGPIGDRFGRKYVIWGSIVGALPFTLALPYVDLAWTVVLSVIIGLVISSAFSTIVVYAQELLPGRVGMVSGLFFGLAFGVGGLGAALLGELADWTSIGFVYQVCSFVPAIGLLTVFLPNLDAARRRA
jgi:FSR family fosmidomycin resistance protein-like MFS transporter